MQGYLFPSFTENSTRVVVSVFIVGVFVVLYLAAKVTEAISAMQH